MPSKLNEKTAHYATVSILSIFLVIAVSITIAQNFTLFVLYDKYQKISAAYATLTTHNAGLRRLPLYETPPDFLYAPINPNLDSSAPAAKNKNPMNIKKLDHDVWEGQIDVDSQGHAVFSSWEYGVRAAALTLRAYAEKHNIDTVDKLVNRFAEAKGRKHAVYVLFLCQSLGVESDQKISLMDYMPMLLRAMSKYESGLDLPEELFVSYDVLGRAR